MNRKNILIIGVIAATANLLMASAALGQSNQSTVTVNRFGSLSFTAIPSSFNFGAANIPSVRTATFSDGTVTSGSLPAAKKLSVQDTRGQGGFSVTLSANTNFTDTAGDSIPVSSASGNLRIVTSPLITGVTGDNVSGIMYETGFGGPETVQALVNTTASDFGSESTFTSVQNNILDTSVPVDVLNGTLSASQGRVGEMSMGVSALLYIPPYQAAGQYMTTLTWTLSDSTT